MYSLLCKSRSVLVLCFCCVCLVSRCLYSPVTDTRLMFMVPVTSTRVESCHFIQGGTPPPHGDVTCPALLTLGEILFDTCAACHQSKMASVPQGYFATKKVKANMNVSCMKTSDRYIPPHYPAMNKKDFEHLPAKYNSKLMNSIWGLYNRYSVHNLKKITDGEKAVLSGAQQL
uniref:Uncharacterized protein n=2 Tax=Timema TaxID=61471 RepID=A0A7R9B3N6_TIMSH|nr:unnamed protein product [Timema shepardi]CAD7572114.1 unnamed protein product [Timema californicum]